MQFYRPAQANAVSTSEIITMVSFRVDKSSGWKSSSLWVEHYGSLCGFESAENIPRMGVMLILVKKQGRGGVTDPVLSDGPARQS